MGQGTHVVFRSDVLSAIGHEKLLHELPGGHAEHEARLCH